MTIRIAAGAATLACMAMSGTAGATVYPTNVTPIALGATAYTQDFDTLASAGTTGSTLPIGWQLSENSANANQTYGVGNGSSDTGNVYSFGTVGTTDRALGSVTSGNLTPAFYGALFTNALDSAIGSLTVAYTGEQWRRGNTPVGSDRLTFQYRLASGNIDTGTWTAVDALLFVAPSTATTAGALNGNLAPNRAGISATISGLSIASGATFAIRWVDLDTVGGGGADDGLGIDDLSVLAAPVSAVPEPASWALMLAGFALTGAVLRRPRAVGAFA